MGRRILSLIGCLAALAVAIASARTGAMEFQVTAPTLPPVPGEVGPAGRIEVDGREVRASTYRSANSPHEEIARHRALWEALPVDLVELPIPGGRLLSAFDAREGRQLVVAAFRRPQGSEVIRGHSPLATAGPVAPLLPLPDDWILASAVDDRLGGARMRTQTFSAPLPLGQVEEILAELLQAHGWRRDATTGGWSRPGARLSIHLEGEGASTVVQLQLLEDRS